MADRQEAFSEPANPATNPPPTATSATAGPLPILLIGGIIVVAVILVIAFVVTRAA